MNYTAEDIEKAKEFKEMGYNWIIRFFGGALWITENRPTKERWGWHFSDGEYAMLDTSKAFKPVTRDDYEPTSLDEIIAKYDKIKPKYERLTDKDLLMNITYNGQYDDMTRFFLFARQLWELENKIESGELIFKEEI